MDNDRQEPPERVAVDGQDATASARLASHTTLRSLFVATAAVAVWASLWRVWPPVLVHWLITPCAACFVSALLGAGLVAGFSIGFATTIALHAHFIANVHSVTIPARSAIDYAFRDALIGVWIVGLTWITAGWWGLYLRFAMSSKDWQYITREIGNATRATCRRTFRDGLLARCAQAAGGYFVISILANVLVYVFTWWLVIVTGWRF